MSVETALEALRLEPRFVRNIVRWAEIPARPARAAAFPAALDPRLIEALGARGIDGLYTHQAEAVAAALRGENTAIVTPAASGKTLCYNLPVLQRLLRDQDGRAMYLFPTKALSQDQLAELADLMDRVQRRTSPAETPLGLSCATYDGDTSQAQRHKIRESARVILTNPDMLHMGILPQHTRWASFFANLRTVVIDEMHAYRGIFGSHVANVLRRLRRICRFYGSDPQFILASATIANPSQLTAYLVEAPVKLIGADLNGAPQGEKQVIFYNPPLLDLALGIRRSCGLEAVDLASHFLAHNVQTVVFARARLTTELILADLREAAGLQADAHSKMAGISQPIRGYRGGYLPSERRDIERGLREGSVRGVVATNALELGIDIGRLEAAVLAGYPGTIASARQQMGRAGRRQGLSVAVLVATAGALDQYIIAHPEYVLDRSPEHALLNPDNEIILSGHLACAAAELPIEAGELFGEAPAGMPRVAHRRVSDLLGELVEAEQLYRAGDRLYWGGEGLPSAAVSLRNSRADRVVIQEARESASPKIIGEVDRASVPLLLYEGAVYLHEGATYVVERLDWNGGIAIVRPAEVGFYTRPSIGEQIEVLAVHAREEAYSQVVGSGSAELVPEQVPGASAGEAKNKSEWTPAATSWGDVRVVSAATGYRIIERATGQLLGFGKIDLPEQVLETQACWLELRQDLIDALRLAGEWYSDPNDYGATWPVQRDAARARDGFRCQSCGTPEIDGRQHDVHHKIPLRAFIADAALRAPYPADLAWKAANRLDNLVTLCPDCHRRAEASVRLHSGLGGVAALLAGVAPLHLMCDPSDLGAVADPAARGSGLPTITIYEKAPGGVGYAAELYESMPELLRAAHETLTLCLCERGCPGCVGAVPEHEYALDAKALAKAILRELSRAI